MENLMSLQPYIRQLRPRNESYIPPIDKVQSLHEAEMTPKELIKYGYSEYIFFNLTFLFINIFR